MKLFRSNWQGSDWPNHASHKRHKFSAFCPSSFSFFVQLCKANSFPICCLSSLLLATRVSRCRLCHRTNILHNWLCTLYVGVISPTCSDVGFCQPNTSQQTSPHLCCTYLIVVKFCLWNCYASVSIIRFPAMARFDTGIALCLSAVLTCTLKCSLKKRGGSELRACGVCICDSSKGVHSRKPLGHSFGLLFLTKSTCFWLCTDVKTAASSAHYSLLTWFEHICGRNRSTKCKPSWTNL
jgi:hypothetical protein